MEKTDLYQTIFKRKSIRNYDLTPLDQSTLTEISDYFNTLTPMYNNIKVELKLISPDNVKRRMMKKAPHYIAIFSENKEGYLANAGFMLQQMDLFLSANEVGSCWQALPKPKKEVLESSNLNFIILIAFGTANEPLHRKSVSEFKRKSIDEISDVAGAEKLVEAARLAPFGSGQSWFFTGNENIIHAYTKPGLIMGLLAKKYVPLDVGIALCHMKLAAEYSGRNTKIVSNKKAKDSTPGGYEYITSLKQI